MNSEEYNKVAPAIAYELGASAALVKFASEYEPSVQKGLHARLLPDHHELLSLFKKAGATVVGNQK